MSAAASRRGTLAGLSSRLVGCSACPRLVAHRAAVARDKRRAYHAETYWGRPVPGFGDPEACVLVVGLAPGAHGANRTGRAFTGDRSGDFLYAALHRAGLASQPTSTYVGDGLRLHDVFITLPVRCVPPGNLPTQPELDACEPWLREELALLSRVRAVVALGRVAYGAVHRVAGARPAAPFGHGARATLPWPPHGGEVTVFASYHVSQQNTQTGRLTPAMFDAVLAGALGAARQSPTTP